MMISIKNGLTSSNVMASQTTTGIARLSIVILVILVITGFLFKFFANAKLSAMDTKKKAEVAQIFTLLQFYYVGENTSPENPSDDWCEINKEYEGKACLREVMRDGYAQAIPQSPDDNLYLYHDDEEKFLIATKMSNKLSVYKRCEYSKDPYMYCKVFKKD